MSTADYIALVAPTTAVIIGFVTLWIHMRLHQRNRRVQAVMQLAKDFYQDSQFNFDRLKLWQVLKDLKDEDHDYGGIVGLVTNDRVCPLKPEEIMALNRTAAFYNSIRGLIDSGEADLDMLRRFFAYNYNGFWNPVRTKFVKHSKSGYDQRFFQEIPELEEDIPALREHLSNLEAAMSNGD